MVLIDKSNDAKTNAEAVNDLMKVYDSCRDLNAEFSAGRRMSSICSDDDEYNSSLPPHPETWPQRPLLLRRTPGAGMTIRGVRYSSSNTYLPSYDQESQHLPINNGLEAKGRCLVIDFESDLFIGTACLRLKNARKSDCDTGTDDSSDSDLPSPNYFHKKKRTFQAIIRGRFKKRIPMSKSVTGQMFSRPAGVLPPRIVVKAAVLLMSRLAPQLQSRLEGECPRFLSPLCSTAQTAYIKKSSQTTGTDEDLEGELQEPHPSSPSSFIQSLPQSRMENHPTLLDSDNKARIKNRKKAFDKLHSNGSEEPSFCPQSEYCFEFFQHLILFDKFALDFPKPVGKHSLKKMLNGQPLRVLAMHQEREQSEEVNDDKEKMNTLWSFDIWHETLYKDASDNSTTDSESSQ